MTPIIECVPNFSEGKNMKLIGQITDEIENIDGVRLLDVDPGQDTNRTVVTFAGAPGAVLDAAVKAVGKAKELIDMRGHHGAHPRMGATDVCPLIPVSDISMEDCVRLAEKLAKMINEATGIPVYLYGEAAKRRDRVNLPDIRKGEYEALEEKLKNPDFLPDAGKPVFLPESGVTAVGARPFMLAYNVNLNTRNLRAAKDIALTLRSSGRAKRDKNNKIIRNENGKMLKVPGKLQFCQAGGWYIDEYGYAQVTMNLHRFDITGLHTAFEAVSEEADKKGLRVTGSELIGLTPLQAVLDAGNYFLKKQNASTGCPRSVVIRTAIQSLGLNETSLFDPAKRIVEYALQDDRKKLCKLSVSKFVHDLSSDSQAPGGGSVAALSASLGSALAAMVANLSFETKDLKERQADYDKTARKTQKMKRRALQLIDEDTDAFNCWMSALRMPKKSDHDKNIRFTAIQEAVLNAILVPMESLKLCRDILEPLDFILEYGNKNALSDAATGVAQVFAGAKAAYYNVLINCPSLENKNERVGILNEAEKITRSISDDCGKLMKKAESGLKQ